MSYDTALAIFSPDGRLLQVERAQQASEQGALVVFSCSKANVTIAIEKRITNKMIVDEELSKLILVDPVQSIYMSYSGLSPDAYVIKNHARLICRNYRLTTGDNITIEQLAYRLSEVKHNYTIAGGKRPFGIRTLLFGCDDRWRVFSVEPDGNFSEYVKGAIGMKSEVVVKYLEEHDDEGYDKEDTLAGIFQVVQNDYKKICCYRIGKEGIERLDDGYVKEYVQTLVERKEAEEKK